MFRHILHTSLYASVASAVISLPVVAAEVPEKLKPWLGPQSWQRDTDGPIVSLGERGQFDDAHIFAPAVIREDGRYLIANEPSKTPAAAGEESADQANATLKIDPLDFPAWQSRQQARLRKMLGIPTQRVPLEAEKRGEIEWDGIVIEKWVFTSEPGSRIPAVLYRPRKPAGKMPTIVFTFGHGGSKSQWQYNYGGLVYAKMGLACLAMDPIGEEERHAQGRLGTRAHDPRPVSDRADRAGRLIMGKLVFDTMRGIDFLMQRDDIAHDRIGVAGNSLGGAKATWMVAIAGSFETYWGDDEFESFSRDGLERLRVAIKRERSAGDQILATFDLHPYPFQEEILDVLAAELEIQGKHRHLVVAATGTGKTMVAAFDYHRWDRNKEDLPSLLFVAHREEILKQALGTFRAVLRDQNFGDLLVGSNEPEQTNHLFCSIQNYNSRELWRLPADRYRYVVIDEFHHAAALSYRRLMDHVRPDILIGLTATPERTDQLDVLGWFDGEASAEIRLPDAIQRRLLCPFQYFGLADCVDLDGLTWQRGGYRTEDLDGVYTGNDARAALVLDKMREIVLNRYIQRRDLGYTPLLFVRDCKRLPSGLSAPYAFLGPADYVSHEGSRPMSVVWRLRYPIPARMLRPLARQRVG